MVLIDGACLPGSCQSVIHPRLEPGLCVCFFFRARGFQLRDNASAHQTLLLPPPSLLLPRELKLAGSLPLSAAITAHTGAPEHTQAHTHTHPLCTVLPFFHRSSLTPDLPV